MIHVQFHPCSNTQAMWTEPNRLLSKNRVSSVHYEGGRHTVKTAFTQIYFILLFPPSSPLSSPVLQISCTSFSLSPLCEHNSLWFGFLTCVQIGKLQDGELSLVRFMWSPGACGRWRVWEVLLVVVGQNEEDISPARSGLALLMLTAWLTPTAAVMWIGPQCCAALGELLSSHSPFVLVFPSCCFSLFAPTT